MRIPLLLIEDKSKALLVELLRDKLFTAIAKAVTVNAYKVNFLDGTNRASIIGGGLCNRKAVIHNILGWVHSEYMRYASLTGILIHYTLQALVRETLKKSDIEGEIRLDLGEKYGIGVIGHYDLLILEIEADGEMFMVVIDIKTVNDINQEPFKYHHYGQLMFYLAYLINKFPDRKILGALWYVDRNYSDPRLLDIINPKNWKFRVFEFDEETVYRKASQGQIMAENLRKDKLPPVIHPSNPYNWMCQARFCPYTELCFGEKPLESFSELLDFANMSQEEYEKQSISFWTGEVAVPS